jgi:hypothetical protein
MSERTLEIVLEDLQDTVAEMKAGALAAIEEREALRRACGIAQDALLDWEWVADACPWCAGKRPRAGVSDAGHKAWCRGEHARQMLMEVI